MAHSPSPAPGVFPSGSHISRRLSASSPPALSKRDKKRQGTEQRLKDIVSHFSNERDIHSRYQLNGILRDMVYIARADPYQNAPLDDSAADMAAEYTSALGPGASEVESNPHLGKYALEFVTVVNDAMEERDARITEVESNLRNEIERMKVDFNYAVKVATVEQQNLKELARTRVYHSVATRRKTLNKDKENADYTDTAALLSVAGITITAPASPGGGHTNRKTRYTRHRQDPENLEAVENSKRKRKVPADFENNSPGPGARIPADYNPLLFWRKNKGAGEQELDLESLSIEGFFGARDLQTHARQACQTVAQAWASKRQPHLNGKGLNGPNGLTNGITLDAEERLQKELQAEEMETTEDVTNLVAPAMDRGGSHATRSTRNNVAELVSRESWEGLDDPHRMYGAGVIEALSIRQKATANNKELEATSPAGLDPSELADDMALFQQMIAEDSA